jgi:hypothetical protein
VEGRAHSHTSLLKTMSVCGIRKPKSIRIRQLERTLCKELNLPGLTGNDIRAKIKTIRTRHASELAKIKKSEISGVGRDDMKPGGQ